MTTESPMDSICTRPHRPRKCGCPSSRSRIDDTVGLTCISIVVRLSCEVRARSPRRQVRRVECNCDAKGKLRKLGPGFVFPRGGKRGNLRS